MKVIAEHALWCGAKCRPAAGLAPIAATWEGPLDFDKGRSYGTEPDTGAVIHRQCGGVAQLVRASACHAEGRGFEPRRSRHSKINHLKPISTCRDSSPRSPGVHSAPPLPPPSLPSPCLSPWRHRQAARASRCGEGRSLAVTSIELAIF